MRFWTKLFSKQTKVLLVELIRTDFKLRYQGSTLGYMWALLRPLFMFAILYAVFGLGLRLDQDIPNFSVYLLLGIVLWGFFAEATKNGMNSIVFRSELIGKIYFPKYIIVIASTISALINLFFNLVVVLLFIILTGADLQWWSIIVFPLLLLELYVFSLAIAFWLSAVNVKYRDISHIWDILIQGGFYASAIFYPLNIVAERSELAAKIILASPVTQIIQDARYALITSKTVTIPSLTGSFFYYTAPFITIAFFIIIAIWYFRKHSSRFAEEI